jgi:hypothetical protein
VQSWNFEQQSTGDASQHPQSTENSENGDATQHPTKTENSEKPSLPTKLELGWAPVLVWMLYSKAHLSIIRVNKTRRRGKEDKQQQN